MEQFVEAKKILYKEPCTHDLSSSTTLQSIKFSKAQESIKASTIFHLFKLLMKVGSRPVETSASKVAMYELDCFLSPLLNCILTSAFADFVSLQQHTFAKDFFFHIHDTVYRKNSIF